MWELIKPLEDGTPVVYVGVHAVRWHPEWGHPTVGFVEADTTNGWLPYPKNKPEVTGATDYLVQLNNGMQTASTMLWVPEKQLFFYDVLDRFYGENEILAYRPLPEPYIEREEQ